MRRAALTTPKRTVGMLTKAAWNHLAGAPGSAFIAVAAEKPRTY